MATMTEKPQNHRSCDMHNGIRPSDCSQLPIVHYKLCDWRMHNTARLKPIQADKISGKVNSPTYSHFYRRVLQSGIRCVEFGGFDSHGVMVLFFCHLKFCHKRNRHSSMAPNIYIYISDKHVQNPLNFIVFIEPKLTIR